MVDIFYQEKHLNNIGRAVQVPLVDVGFVSHTALVVVPGKQSGSHDLPGRSRYEWISPQRTSHVPGVLGLCCCTSPRVPGQCRRTRPDQTPVRGHVTNVSVWSRRPWTSCSVGTHLRACYERAFCLPRSWTRTGSPACPANARLGCSDTRMTPPPFLENLRVCYV
jgi:hypothetical protein